MKEAIYMAVTGGHDNCTDTFTDCTGTLIANLAPSSAYARLKIYHVTGLVSGSKISDRVSSGTCGLFLFKCSRVDIT